MGDLFQRQEASRAFRVFHLKIIRIIIMEAEEALDDQEIYGHPYRAAPIAVATKYATVTFSRNIFYHEFFLFCWKYIRLLFVAFGEASDAIIA
ncbi:hypothetical protein D3C71_2027540 [compost metagenome]